MSGNRAPLLVSAAIIYRNGRVLVGQRREIDRHPLKWEFPGGKVELGESPRQALVRELREELQIDATVGAELARYQYEYSSGNQVRLIFFAVQNYTGEPRGCVFKQICWAALGELALLDFLEADISFVRRLALGDFERELAPDAL